MHFTRRPDDSSRSQSVLSDVSAYVDEDHSRLEERIQELRRKGFTRSLKKYERSAASVVREHMRAIIESKSPVIASNRPSHVP
jgi:hypothetical protein